MITKLKLQLIPGKKTKAKIGKIHIKDDLLKVEPINDSLKQELKPEAAYGGLLDTLNAGGDVYDYMNAEDSFIREQAFARLSELINCDYDAIYKLWMEA